MGKLKSTLFGLGLGIIAAGAITAATPDQAEAKSFLKGERGVIKITLKDEKNCFFGKKEQVVRVLYQRDTEGRITSVAFEGVDGSLLSLFAASGFIGNGSYSGFFEAVGMKSVSWDGDFQGAEEITRGDGSAGLKIDDLETPIFEDGFETGDTSSWTQN